MCVSQGDWDIVCVYLKVIRIQCVSQGDSKSSQMYFICMYEQSHL